MLVLASGPALAYPLLPLRIAGEPFEGPADAEATALWWNPASLASMHGLRITLLGSGRFASGEIDRAPICPADDGQAHASCSSGAPRSFGAESLARDFGSGFGALTVNFNDNITLGFGVYSPWISCPVGAHCTAGPTQQGLTGGLPGAYHSASESFTTIYFSLGGALRISSKLSFGVSVSLIDSFEDLTLYRDTALESGPDTTQCGGRPCGYENPLAASRVRVRGDGGTFWGGIPLPTGIAANFGMRVHPADRLWLGFSWQRVFPAFSASQSFGVGDPQGAQVTPPANSSLGCTAGSDGRTCTGGDAILFSLPDVWHLGALIQLRENLWLSTWGRVVTYGGYSTPDATQRGTVLQLSGDAVQRGGAPRQIVIDQGLRPTFAFEGGLRWLPRRSLRLAASIAIEGWGAVDPRLVSASAIDGPKLDAIVGAEWQATRWLKLVLAYEFTYVIPVDSSPSSYDPNATVRCVRSGYSVDQCQDALEGRGLPTAAGTYTLNQHLVTLGFKFDFLQPHN